MNLSVCNVQSSLTKTSVDDAFSSCGRSDASDISSAASSVVSDRLLVNQSLARDGTQ